MRVPTEMRVRRGLTHRSLVTPQGQIRRMKICSKIRPTRDLKPRSTMQIIRILIQVTGIKARLWAASTGYSHANEKAIISDHLYTRWNNERTTPPKEQQSRLLFPWLRLLQQVLPDPHSPEKVIRDWEMSGTAAKEYLRVSLSSKTE